MSVKSTKTTGWFILSVLALFYSSICHANIIDDIHGAGAGSFELGNYIDGGGIPPTGLGWMGVAAGDNSTITGWTVGGPGDGVDWLAEPIINADTGIHSVDLQHQTPSSISTVIPTIIGNLYELSFAAATFGDEGDMGVVSAGTLINQEFTAQRSVEVDSQVFAPFTFEFTAIGLTTTIQFASTSQPSTNHYGPAIDSVSVVALEEPPPEPIPEPSTMILLSVGVASILGSRRRRKKELIK